MSKVCEISIINGYGKDKNVQIPILNAMDAWEFRQKFRWFLSTDDVDKKRSFIGEVFGSIRVETSDGNFTPLLTDAIISNHIGNGDKCQSIISDLFYELLVANQIDKTWCAERLTYGKNLGDKIAQIFLAACIPKILACNFIGE